jgi:6-phosphogluconolactonase
MSQPTVGPVLHHFAQSAQMADAVAQWVADRLRDALRQRARATLVVSGGKTPAAVWQILCQTDLPWECVDITLADERWVPSNHPDSNEALVRAHLLQSRAAQARWWPLFDPSCSLAEAVQRKGLSLHQHLHWPADVVMLGMGNDGHTASWFPGQPMPESHDWCMATPVPAAPNVQQPRLSFTPHALLDAASLLVLLQGQDKQATLGQALMSPQAGQPWLPVQLAMWRTSGGVQGEGGCEVFFSP